MSTTTVVVEREPAVAPDQSKQVAREPMQVAPTIKDMDRLVSLDVFRGITIAGMVLVNNPGSWSSIYWPLEHAEWHGWTPTDLVFPFFLFIVGASITLAFGRRLEDG